MGFRADSYLNPASTLLGKEGEGLGLNTSPLLEEEVLISVVAESFLRISLVK